MRLEEARRLAEKWVERLSKCCCLKVDIAGSTYRGEPNPRDVDLVCVPRDMEALREAGLVKEMDKTRITFKDGDQHIDVWLSTPERYPLTLWFRRMGAKRFIELASKAKAKGLKLSWKDGLMRDGETITLNPEEIEKYLGEN